jgi:hypothetical protein
MSVEVPATAAPAATASKDNSPRHIRLTSHAGGFGALPIHGGCTHSR